MSFIVASALLLTKAITRFSFREKEGRAYKFIMNTFEYIAEGKARVKKFVFLAQYF